MLGEPQPLPPGVGPLGAFFREVRLRKGGGIILPPAILLQQLVQLTKCNLVGPSFKLLLPHQTTLQLYSEFN